MAADTGKPDEPILSHPEDLTANALAAANRLHDIVHAARPGGIYDPARNPGGCDKTFCCRILIEVPAVIEPAIRADERMRRGAPVSAKGRIREWLAEPVSPRANLVLATTFSVSGIGFLIGIYAWLLSANAVNAVLLSVMAVAIGAVLVLTVLHRRAMADPKGDDPHGC